MRKVAYQNRNILKTYMQIFQPTLTKMQTSWESLRKTNVELQQFPTNIQDILIGNFHNQGLCIIFLVQNLEGEVQV